jgi:hypothetical protein
MNTIVFSSFGKNALAAGLLALSIGLVPYASANDAMPMNSRTTTQMNSTTMQARPMAQQNAEMKTMQPMTSEMRGQEMTAMPRENGMADMSTTTYQQTTVMESNPNAMAATGMQPSLWAIQNLNPQMEAPRNAADGMNDAQDRVRNAMAMGYNQEKARQVQELQQVDARYAESLKAMGIDPEERGMMMGAAANVQTTTTTTRQMTEPAQDMNMNTQPMNNMDGGSSMQYPQLNYVN